MPLPSSTANSGKKASHLSERSDSYTRLLSEIASFYTRPGLQCASGGEETKALKTALGRLSTQDLNTVEAFSTLLNLCLDQEKITRRLTAEEEYQNNLDDDHDFPARD